MSDIINKELDFEREYEDIKRCLGMIGLSSYEAKAYLALVAHGYASADIIAQTALIPRTSAYKVLQGLHEKGFIISTEGRPKIYKPEELKNIREEFIATITTTFEKLEMIHEILGGKGIPQLVYTIVGKQKVIEKIGELLDKSNRTFIISTPSLLEIREELDRKFQNALNRGIRITIITSPFKRIWKGTNAVWRKGLIATDVISDGKTALLASRDLNACGYTDNPSLAEHLENFLEIMMRERI